MFASSLPLITRQLAEFIVNFTSYSFHILWTINLLVVGCHSDPGDFHTLAIGWILNRVLFTLLFRAKHNALGSTLVLRLLLIKH